jgi:hypothetical protein
VEKTPLKLGTIGRGRKMEINISFEWMIKARPELMGNIVEPCPVGALVSYGLAKAGVDLQGVAEHMQAYMATFRFESCTLNLGV